MEKAGLVRRERDSEDRRKVFIVPVAERVVEIGRFYEPMQRAMHKLWDTYTDAELKLLLRFANQGYKAVLAATEELKTVMAARKEKRARATKPARAP
jgi:hypothetical protein